VNGLEIESKIRECRNEVDASLAILHCRMDDFTRATATLGEIKKAVDEMREMLEAWNSAKGFVTTVKFISAFLKYSAVVGAAVGMVWYLIKFGHLPPVNGK
jgi:hypothetical protein